MYIIKQNLLNTVLDLNLVIILITIL